MTNFDYKKFLAESKATFFTKLNENASSVAEKFAQHMSKKEGKKFTVTPGSVDEKSFDLDLDGEKYMGGSYLVKDNGDIINVAMGNKVSGNVNQLEEGEAAYEYEKGKKAGEKMAKSELKEIYIAHLDKELDMSILSYMADVFISNAKDGDSKYKQFLDLNLRDAIFDVIDILNNKRHPLYMDALEEYNTVEADKIKGLFRENKSNKMTKSELKAKIKEMIVAEQEGDEEAEVEATDDVTTGDEEVTTNTTVAEVDPNIEAVQDALTQAQAAAQKLGDDKLMDQIGNTITFFTRTHVVEKPAGAVSEEMFSMLKKILK